MTSTKFHFQEVDWVLYFPSHGNEGRDFLRYGVAYRDRHRGIGQPGRRIDLEDVLEEPAIRDHYPHRVGLFHESEGKGQNWRPTYLETRSVNSQQELFEWFRQLGL